jgi:hypothetical protein
VTAKKQSVAVNDIDKLEELIEIIYQDLTEEGGRFKIMELLKTMEFKRKIAPPDDREGAFWDMIDELRVSELNHPTPHHQSAIDQPVPKKRKTPKSNKKSHKSQ